MPIHRGADSIGIYYQWGNHGHKYYYILGDNASRNKARLKAERQARAAHSRGFVERIR